MLAWSRHYRTENNVAKGWRWEGSVGTRLKTGDASCACRSWPALLAGFLVCVHLGPILQDSVEIVLLILDSRFLALLILDSRFLNRQPPTSSIFCTFGLQFSWAKGLLGELRAGTGCMNRETNVPSPTVHCL